MTAPAILATSTVDVRHVTVTYPPGDCDNCHEPDSAVVHVHWTPRDEPAGYLEVCLTKACVHWAVGKALDDSPEDSPVTVELAHRDSLEAVAS